MNKIKKKMGKKFVVGKTPTIKTFIIACIVLFLIDVLLMGFLIASIDAMISIDAIKLLNIALVVFYIFLFLIYGPSVMICSEHWDVTDTHLEYYSINGHFRQLVYAFNVLFGREDMFSSKVELNSIKEIKLFWKEGILGVVGATTFAYKYYEVYFAITLVDDSIVIFQSLLANDNNNKEFIDALDYLENNYNIIINDSYGLKETIGNPNVDLYEYITEVKKKLNNDEGGVI